MKDEIFAKAKPLVTDFAFDQETAKVFDDMVNRSVPFYEEMQRMTTEIAADFATPGSMLYDLGCSTGTTLLALHEKVHPDVQFVGIDESQEMLDKARTKFNAISGMRPVDLQQADFHQGLFVQDASVVSMILTLQFIRPLYRHKIVQAIYEGLQPQGTLILIEKVTAEDTLFNRLFIKYYYDYKRRMGYSDLEIAQKREALENVLIPYRIEENMALLKEAGFKNMEVFFRWYNFAGVVAVK